MLEVVLGAVSCCAGRVCGLFAISTQLLNIGIWPGCVDTTWTRVAFCKRVICSTWNLRTRKAVALLTSDAGFLSAVLHVQSSHRTRCVVFVPQDKASVISKYATEGLQVVSLQAEVRDGAKVRAVLHDSGEGSVHLSDSFQKLSSKEFDVQTRMVSDFLDKHGYGVGEGYTLQGIAKFWFANRFSTPLTVFPSQMGLNQLYDLIGQGNQQTWSTCSTRRAFLLPRSTEGRLTKTGIQTYGSRAANAIYRGGGPLMLKDSSDLTSEALQKLGFLDDQENADLTEAMFCFLNATRNKTALRLGGMLPVSGAPSIQVEKQLRQIFLSNAFSGQWQFCNKSATTLQHIIMILRQAKILSPQSSGFEPTRREVFEGMKAYAKSQKLPRMVTFNALVWRILRHNERNPCRRGDIQVGKWLAGWRFVCKVISLSRDH